MTRVGDRDRERTTASLRRHFAEGRLSVEELGQRAELALAARSQHDLRAALRDLPGWWQDAPERIASVAATARRGVRLAALLLLAAVWSVITLAFAIAFAVTLAVFGASLSVVFVFLVAWILVTFLLWRPWLPGRRSPAR